MLFRLKVDPLLFICALLSSQWGQQPLGKVCGQQLHGQQLHGQQLHGQQLNGLFSMETPWGQEIQLFSAVAMGAGDPGHQRRYQRRYNSMVTLCCCLFDHYLFDHYS